MHERELSEARQTLDLSDRTASRFVAELGALAPILIPPFPAAHLGRRAGGQPTVLDQKYWFAKLYALVSYEELDYSAHTDYPGFSLHFMKVFYGMYHAALLNFLARKFADVSPLWVTHFRGPITSDKSPIDPASMEAVQFSVRTGAAAHIQGDMPKALVDAYKSWAELPKPPFSDLKNDFINKSQHAFEKAQARFYIDVNNKTFSPLRPEVGQLAAAYYQAIYNIQPSLPVMLQWRRDAWQTAQAAF